VVQKGGQPWRESREFYLPLKKEVKQAVTARKAGEKDRNRRR